MKFATKPLFYVLGLYLLGLTACRSPEEKIQSYGGSLVPGNPREQMIFDYYKALKEKRFKDAYQFVSGSEYFSSLDKFISDREANYSALPILIGIGEEHKTPSEDVCFYVYEVFEVDTDAKGGSGYFIFHSDPEKPGKCKILGYKVVLDH